MIYEIKSMWVGKRGLKQTWSGPEEVYYFVIVLGQSQTTATAALNYFHTSSEEDKSQKIAEVGYEKPSTMCGKVFTGTWFLLNHLTHSQVTYFINTVSPVHISHNFLSKQPT